MWYALLGLGLGLYLLIAVITVPIVARRQANTQIPGPKLPNKCVFCSDDIEGEVIGRKWKGDGTIGTEEFSSGLSWGLFWPFALLYFLCAFKPTEKAKLLASEEKAAKLEAEIAQLDERLASYATKTN